MQQLRITIKGTGNDTVTFTVPVEGFNMKKEADGATTLRYTGGSASYPAAVRVNVEIAVIATEPAAS